MQTHNHAPCHSEMESQRHKREQQTGEADARDAWEAEGADETGSGREEPPTLPTLAQNTQQQGAGTEQNIQAPQVLLCDANHLLHQLWGPRQACGVHGTGEARESWAL